MIRRTTLSILAAFAAFALVQQAPAWQQAPAAPPLKTYEVNADHTVTFRYNNPSASKVIVNTDASLQRIPMTKGGDGVWTATTAPLTPEIYGYSFVVDGVEMLDPRNNHVKHNLIGYTSEFVVPAQPSAPWEVSNIAHGTVSRHIFTTKVAKNLPSDQSAYVVYTPPGYDPKHKGGYPVLYLLHGYTDTEDGWTSVGRANLIMDSMIDGGKAVPMIVVMPLGYGDFNFVLNGHGAWDDLARVNGNVLLFWQSLQSEVMPAVEREYNVAKGRENRAIAGLSMGGLESLTIGLNHSDQFAYVAGFSSATAKHDFDQMLPNLDARKANLKLLWVACGTDDHLIAPNRAFFTWAKAKNLPLTPIETPGAHTWLVWRDNLLNVGPLLFRK